MCFEFSQALVSCAEVIINSLVCVSGEPFISDTKRTVWFQTAAASKIFRKASDVADGTLNSHC